MAIPNAVPSLTPSQAAASGSRARPTLAATAFTTATAATAPRSTAEVRSAASTPVSRVGPPADGRGQPHAVEQHPRRRRGRPPRPTAPGRRVAGASSSPPSAGPDHERRDLAGHQQARRALGAADRRVRAWRRRGPGTPGWPPRSPGSRPRGRARSGPTARAAATAEEQRPSRASRVSRTMRSRAKRSASRPAAQDNATYGSIRAAPATPRTQPSPARSHTSRTSSGHGQRHADGRHRVAGDRAAGGAVHAGTSPSTSSVGNGAKPLKPTVE